MSYYMHGVQDPNVAQDMVAKYLTLRTAIVDVANSKYGPLAVLRNLLDTDRLVSMRATIGNNVASLDRIMARAEQGDVAALKTLVPTSQNILTALQEDIEPSLMQHLGTLAQDYGTAVRLFAQGLGVDPDDVMRTSRVVSGAAIFLGLIAVAIYLKVR